MGSNNMIPDNQPHYSYLKKSYDEVGKRTWQNDDFVMSSLDSSRNLFTDESLRALKPKPKNWLKRDGIIKKEEFAFSCY